MWSLIWKIQIKIKNCIFICFQMESYISNIENNGTRDEKKQCDWCGMKRMENDKKWNQITKG